MSVNLYVVQCNAQNSAKRVLNNPWEASLIHRGWNILPRAPRIHITEQQSPLDVSVIFQTMMMNKCKNHLYWMWDFKFFSWIPKGQLLILHMGVRYLSFF